MGDSVLGHERHLLLDPHDPLSDLSGLKCDNAKTRVQELLSIKGALVSMFCLLVCSRLTALCCVGLALFNILFCLFFCMLG